MDLIFRKLSLVKKKSSHEEMIGAYLNGYWETKFLRGTTTREEEGDDNLTNSAISVRTGS